MKVSVIDGKGTAHAAVPVRLAVRDIRQALLDGRMLYRPVPQAGLMRLHEVRMALADVANGQYRHGADLIYRSEAKAEVVTVGFHRVIWFLEVRNE